MQKMVILGGGTGGTLAANRLRKKFPASELQIDVVDQNDHHLYQPGLLFVPFGLADPEDIVRNRDKQLHTGINYQLGEIDLGRRGGRHGAPRRRQPLQLRRAGGRHRRPAAARGDRGPDRPRLESRTSSPSTTCPAPRRWPNGSRRFDGGHLVINVVDLPDQVPGRSARVRLPRRLVLPPSGVSATRSSSPTSPRSTARSPSRSLQRAGRAARREGHRPGHRVQHRRGRRRRRTAGLATTSGRSPSTWRS